MSTRAGALPRLPPSPSRRSPRVLAVAGACACLAVGAGVAVGLERSSSSSAAPKGSSARLLSRLAPSQRIRFTLDLVLPGAAALHTAIGAIENPRSSQFHRYISAAAFGARYGISSARLRRLQRTLEHAQVRVLETYPQRTALQVSSTVATLRRLLHVGMGSFTDGDGNVWHAPLGRVVIPAAWGSEVSGITGLSTRPTWQPEDVPSNGLAPPYTQSAYDITPLVHQNILGQGQSIAIAALSDFDHADPASYASAHGLSGPAPTLINIDGGTTDTSGADETNLDIDVMRSVAPEAHVLVYEAPDSPTGFADVLNQVIAGHTASIVSTSWGQCIPDLNPTEQAADAKALAAAVRVGITVFAASGDNGAYDCQANDLSDHRLSIDWPGASPDAVSVGGTRLYLNSNGSYDHEAGWEGALSNQGSGGGLATGIPQPSWQTGPGVHNSSSNGQRQAPDVAADADPGTGWNLFSSGPANSSGGFSGGSLEEAGGTSAAAPFWAASLALIEQYVQAHGGGRVGFADPMFYALAAGGAKFPPFHDVTLGGNRFYPATKGWDFATGLGSPDVYNLARDTVVYLQHQ